MIEPYRFNTYDNVRKHISHLPKAPMLINIISPSTRTDPGHLIRTLPSTSVHLFANKHQENVKMMEEERKCPKDHSMRSATKALSCKAK